MRENCTYGSAGGEAEINRPSLPRSKRSRTFLHIVELVGCILPGATECIPKQLSCNSSMVP